MADVNDLTALLKAGHGSSYAQRLRHEAEELHAK
jgi:hypothetical protein